MAMLTWLDGKKTQLGGIIKLLTGIATILATIAALITKYVDPTSEVGQISIDAAMAALLTAIYMIGQGLSTIGLGHKLEKARTAQIETAEATKATAKATQAIEETNETIATEAKKP